MVHRMMEEQKTEFVAIVDANKEEFLEAQRLLFEEHECSIRKKLADMTRIIHEIKDLCEANKIKLEEQSSILIKFCLKVKTLEQNLKQQ